MYPPDDDPGAPPAPPPGLLGSLSAPGRLARLARKELTEVLRDRRTIVTLLLMPVLLYPLLAVAFQQFFLSELVGEVGPTYRLGFRSQEEGQALFDYLQIGQQALAAGEPVPARRAEPQLDFFVAGDLDEAVRAGQVDVGFVPGAPGPFRAQADRELALDCAALYREDSPYGREALRHVERLCAAANARFLSVRLERQRVPQRPDPVRLVGTPVPAPEGKQSWLAALVPLVLILMTITGAVYPAIDLTAGERERGTLEILIAAPIPRLGLLVAKYVAVLTVAVLTAVVNLGTMTVTLWLTGLGRRVFPGGLSPLVLLEVFGLLLLFAAFFSAVLLILTSFARSFKEAQAALIPLMLVSLLPGVLALVPGLDLAGPLALVPLLNIVLLARDLLGGQASLLPALVVIVSTLGYALAALAVASRVFGAEAVLYSESAGWGGWFRRGRGGAARPEDPPAPGPA